MSAGGGIGGFMGSANPENPKVHLKQKLIELEGLYLNPVFPFLTQNSTPEHESSAV